MAGGIFTSRAFELNIKCVVFAAIMILLYVWLVPNPNYFLIPIIYIVSYVALAWYDYFYNCEQRLYSGTGISPFAISDSVFKPQRRDLQKDDPTIVPEKEAHLLLGPGSQEDAYLQKVYLFHMVVVVPLLGYIAYMRRDTPEGVFGALFGLTAIAAIYHGYRLFVQHRETNC